jgi:uncharacterized membrane protein
MKQSEYLRELEINLESGLSPAEVKDILSDYESFFTTGREEGKSDDNISEELGSPAYLAKTLIDEHHGSGSRKESKKESNNEPYKESGSNPGIAAKPSANPGRRLCAYLVDSVIAVLPAMLLSLIFMAGMNLSYMMFIFSPSPVVGASAFFSYSAYTVEKSGTVISTNTKETNRDVISTQVYRKGLDGEWASSRPNKGSIAFAVFSLAFYLLYSTVSTFLFKGQTFGKKLMRIKVRRTSTEQVSGGMIFIREFLGKVLLNSIPIVAIVSLFTMLLTKDHRTLHDMLADTVVTES